MFEEHGTDLSALTTIRVGGPAARLVTAETTDELVDAVREVDEAGEECLVLGGGSNVVVSDEGFTGSVVRVATRGVTVERDGAAATVAVRIAAGEVWDDVVTRAVEEGWAGIEALSGIPGCVGATPIQNVGAYGQEVSQTITRVRVWDRAGQRVRVLGNADCGFTYRGSRFKAAEAAAPFVVLDVRFRLRLATVSEPIGYADLARELDVAPGARVPLSDARSAVLALRRRRGMVLDAPDHDTWSCGSFFTNPILTEAAFAELETRVVGAPRFPAGEGLVKTSAAWLIERAGFGRGYGLPGPAALSSKHTLAITNRGGAKAADILALAREIRDRVEVAFGVGLVAEPVLVGLTL